MALQAKRFKWRKPIIPEDDEDEGQGDEEDEMEGNIDDLINQDLSDDEDVAEFVEEIPDDIFLDLGDKETIKQEKENGCIIF